MALLIALLLPAGLGWPGAAPCSEARPLRGVTGLTEKTDNPETWPGLLDFTQGMDPLMRLSQPDGGGGSCHSTAPAPALQR